MPNVGKEPEKQNDLLQKSVDIVFILSLCTTKLGTLQTAGSRHSIRHMNTLMAFVCGGEKVNLRAKLLGRFAFAY